MNIIPGFQIRKSRDFQVLTLMGMQYISLPVPSRQTIRVYGTYYYAVSSAQLIKLCSRV